MKEPACSMNTPLRDRLLAEIQRIPIIDVHSHMDRDQLAAKDPASVVLYHMQRYPLRAAGADPNLLWPERGSRARDPQVVLEAWADHFHGMSNTAFARMLRGILYDLYGFEGPINRRTLPDVVDRINAKLADPDHGRNVLRKAGVVRIISSQTNVRPLPEGQTDDLFRFTIEAPAFSPNRESEDGQARLESLSSSTNVEVRDFQSLCDAMAAYYDRFDWQGKLAYVAWVSAMADFVEASDAAMDAAIRDTAAGRRLDPVGQRVREAAILRAACRGLQGHTGLFQVVYGTQFVSPPDPANHPVTRAWPLFASGFGRLAGEHPDLHFNILSGVENDEPAWCSLTQGYANVSFGSYWWSGFYPTAMHNGWHRRLDMTPLTRLCGFFSDGYCVDWIYARVRATQRVLANVLTEKIERGEYGESQAVDIARSLLFETPRQIFLPDETITV